MSNHTLAMALAKVMIAAAWADGDLAHDEVNSLKRLLAQIPDAGTGPDGQLTANEWAELEIYLHSPVSPAERARLVAELRASLRGPGDRRFAIAALEHMVGADRVATEAERAAVAEIRAALEAADLGLFASLGRLVRGMARSPASGPNREQYLDDFIKNRVFFALRQRQSMDPDADLGISDAEARKLGLAGGLLAVVARVDNAVTVEERDTLERVLQEGWGISATSAILVAELALAEAAADLNVYQLTQEFVRATSVEERLRFLDVLFAVAAADGQVSSAENAEIIRIANSIHLENKHIVAARQRLKKQGVEG